MEKILYQAKHVRNRALFWANQSVQHEFYRPLHSSATQSLIATELGKKQLKTNWKSNIFFCNQVRTQINQAFVFY